MFDDSSDKDRKKQSLLSLSAPAAEPAARVGSLLTASGSSDRNDPAARHRHARSRREAAPGPLLSALAKMEGFRAEPAAEEPKKSRWSLRDLLSQKLKFEKSAPEPGGSRRAIFAEAPKPAEAPTPRRPIEPAAMAASPPTSRGAAPAKGPAIADDSFIDDTMTVAADAAPGDPIWRPLVDPMQVIRGVFNSKTLILTATIAGGLLGAAISLSTPKKYEAFSELLVDPRDLKVSDRDLTQTGLTSDALVSLVENQVRVLTSGTVLNKVTDELKLQDDPEFNGERKSFGLGSIIGALRSLLSRGGGAGEEDNRRAIAVGNLADALHVERSGRTFIVTVSATTEDAEKSAQIVNAVNDVFLQTTGELQSDTAGRAADELNSRLAELRSSVEEAERNVETFKAEHDLIDAQGRLITDDELVKLNDQLATARARTIELNARAASLRTIKIDSVIGSGLPEELTSSVMTELRAQYATIKQEADRLSVRLGPRHPQYLAQQAQLQGARERIENELRRIVASAQTELKRAVQLEQDLAARLAQLKVRSGDVNGDLVTLREFEREAAAKRTVYENYLLRAKEAGEQRDINTANISVISPAFPPLDPTGPSRATIAMTGAVLGFFAGVALGMARGIFWSLRDRNRTRRNLRPGWQQTAATERTDMSEAAARMNVPDEKTRHFEEPEVSSQQIAAEMSREAATNPLVRLIERIRWPARTGSAGKSSTMPLAASAETANSNFEPKNPEPKNPEPNTHSREARESQEAPQMYPYQQQPSAYPQHQPHPQAAPYPQAPVQPYAPYPATYAPPPQYPPAFGPQPVVYPYPAAVPPQPAFHGWQPQPAPMTPYGYPQPVAAHYPAYPPAAPQQPVYAQEARPAAPPAQEVRAAAQPREMSPIEEVRESLREFREAIRDLVEDRARRRYS
jgi:succinoglycan biosynthesis transport protein ExoP